MSPQQLTLNVKLRDGFRFESFYVDKDSKESNDEICKVLQEFVRSTEAQQNLLWGEKFSGKTHLLQACCAVESLAHRPVSYIPLNVLSEHGTSVLEGLLHAKLIVIDDVDTVIGNGHNKDWEIALFNLINQTRENKQRLLLSSRENPRKLKCILPDLASRLIWGGSYQLHALTDEEKPKALQARAEQRGFELSDRVIEYLFRRYPRDIASLMGILDKLDEESLRQKMVITVPFVKQVLEDF
ncbi:MAG: DnaA regulatory inactivator Hda [Cocleimonas sp.]